MSLAVTRRHALQGLALAALPLRTWADSPALTFLAVGDWGRHGGDHQQEVADRMGETAAQIGARFVISVGDNFYEDGVTGIDDPAWNSSFENVYRAPSLQVPWYAALGNHDYQGDVQAQVDYTAKSPRWRMPARWQSFKERAPDGTNLEVFIIDTNPMIKSYHADGSKVKVAGQDVEAQMAWFERGLAASTADWKIVVGHHPVYSGGVLGGPPKKGGGESNDGGTPELIARIDPILQRYRVPLYLNGHDHDLQHVRRGGTDYVCTGAGSKVRNRCEMAGSDFCSLQSGFIACSVDRARLRVAYRDYMGSELHVIDIAHSG